MTLLLGVYLDVDKDIGMLKDWFGIDCSVWMTGFKVEKVILHSLIAAIQVLVTLIF